MEKTVRLRAAPAYPRCSSGHTAPAALVNGQTAAFVFHLSASLSAPSLLPLLPSAPSAPSLLPHSLLPLNPILQNDPK